jgi:hypothetical protein
MREAIPKPELLPLGEFLTDRQGRVAGDLP